MSYSVRYGQVQVELTHRLISRVNTYVKVYLSPSPILPKDSALFMYAAGQLTPIKYARVCLSFSRFENIVVN